MHTMMDNHDLVLTAEESLEHLASAIEALAMDSVFAFVEEGELQVQFADQTRILAKGDLETGLLVLDAPGHSFNFYWDDVAEDWFAKEHEARLVRVVEKLIAEHTGTQVSLENGE